MKRKDRNGAQNISDSSIKGIILMDLQPKDKWNEWLWWVRVWWPTMKTRRRMTLRMLISSHTQCSMTATPDLSQCVSPKLTKWSFGNLLWKKKKREGNYRNYHFALGVSMGCVGEWGEPLDHKNPSSTPWDHHFYTSSRWVVSVFNVFALRTVGSERWTMIFSQGSRHGKFALNYTSPQPCDL